MNIICKTRLFVEKKEAFEVEAQSLKNELNNNLHLSINELRLIIVYDVFNIDEKLLESAMVSVFSEPVTDNICRDVARNVSTETSIAIEFSPFRPFALSPFRPFALSPFRPFALSPFRPFALSPFFCVINLKVKSYLLN